MTSADIFEREYYALIVSYLKDGNDYGQKEQSKATLDTLSRIYKAMGFTIEQEKALIENARKEANFTPFSE